MVPCVMRWSSGTYNDKPMPATVDPHRVAAVAKYPSAYFGDKGTAVSGWWMDDARLFPEDFMRKVGRPKKVIPRVKSHEADFLNAVRTGGRSSADFDYSARLVEIMLVGNIASLVREKLCYDFRTGMFTNSDKANALLGASPARAGSSATSESRATTMNLAEPQVFRPLIEARKNWPDTAVQ